MLISSGRLCVTNLDDGLLVIRWFFVSLFFISCTVCSYMLAVSFDIIDNTNMLSQNSTRFNTNTPAPVCISFLPNG